MPTLNHIINELVKLLRLTIWYCQCQENITVVITEQIHNLTYLTEYFIATSPATHRTKPITAEICMIQFVGSRAGGGTVRSPTGAPRNGSSLSLLRHLDKLQPRATNCNSFSF